MNTFADMGINDDLLKGLASLGFQEPTPVQAKVIPLVLERKVDLVSLAQTGTGKTGAFGLPLLQLTNIQNKQTQALVLCPTRELCVQVARDLAAFAQHVAGLRILAVYGGASIEQQIKALRSGIHIIVATPGRLNDLINRGKVDISAVGYVVFDEADEMLKMGFQDELNAILAKTPKEKNTLLFSATMSKEVAAIAGKYMSNAVEVTIGQRNAGAENVRHEYYMVQAKDRYLALKRIVDNCPEIYSIIFCRTRQETNEIAGKLIQDGYNADALHGELTQVQRDQVMHKFRGKTLQILVATDVAARGLDVTDLTHVINYNLPDDISNYTHRSGRTGRAGRDGISVAIVHLKEQFKIREIERRINKKFKLCLIPSGVEVCKKQLVRLIDVVTKVEVNHAQIDPLYAEISEKLGSFAREELIKRFISVEFNRYLEYYQNAPDLNVSSGAHNQPVKRGPVRAPSADQANRQSGFTRFMVNVGRRDGLTPQDLLGKINSASGAGRVNVGKIEILRNSAMVEADSRFAQQVLGAFQNFKLNGKTVAVEVAPGNYTASRPKAAPNRPKAGASRAKPGVGWAKPSPRRSKPGGLLPPKVRKPKAV
jgi:ATP-dependent RNA helicase DeaD